MADTVGAHLLIHYLFAYCAVCLTVPDWSLALGWDDGSESAWSYLARPQWLPESSSLPAHPHTPAPDKSSSFHIPQTQIGMLAGPERCQRIWDPTDAVEMFGHTVRHTVTASEADGTQADRRHCLWFQTRLSACHVRWIYLGNCVCVYLSLPLCQNLDACMYLAMFSYKLWKSTGWTCSWSVAMKVCVAVPRRCTSVLYFCDTLRCVMLLC